MTYGHNFESWRAASPDWDAYTRAPFLAALADGTLPQATFLHYLAQDYLFLGHFSRAWGLAIAKSGDPSEMRACATMVHALLHDEMALHIGICAQAGLSRADLLATAETPATLGYTRYVMDAGYTGGFLDLLAALAPCVLGYGEIGARLVQGTTDTPYRAWIETYGGADYQALCHETGALIDGAIASRLGESPRSVPYWQDLTNRFATATQLEAQFWPALR
ncbi:TenA family protein [Falsirhodobacter sp. alg1]|uniref:TenA family protein n=1 Tax=Falsirhodobacter sp. alg1 TaxID=1472418 RepID=UPI0005F0322A|nr:TenA family protein [Falsirhodobacter sp. alg1]